MLSGGDPSVPCWLRGKYGLILYRRCLDSRLIAVSGNTLRLGDRRYRCAIGKNGIAADKREGDGKTPAGSFPLRECWYRADRLPAPAAALPLRVIHPDDGWCDDPAHPLYNRHVKLPFMASHETLWREDGVYDFIVPLGYNDDPVVPGRGSAIFLHVAKPDYSPTEGCVALAKGDLLEVLAGIRSGAAIVIGL